MKTAALLVFLFLVFPCAGNENFLAMSGVASWYGEAHRGKPMANRQPFDPNKMTAASWFYPLGTKVRVTLQTEPNRTVIVTITDRGPHRRFVAKGRIIDLSRAAFKSIAPLRLGLVPVIVDVIEPASNTRAIAAAKNSVGTATPTSKTRPMTATSSKSHEVQPAIIPRRTMASATGNQ